jgi:type I restriction enzyme S subunit
MSELPDGWVQAKLSNVADFVMGQSPPSNTYNTSKRGLPFFQGKAEFGDLYPTVKKYCSHPLKVAKTGDVLISVRAPVGPTNLCAEESCIGRGLAAIRPIGNIPSLFLLYYLRCIEGWLSEQGTGSTFTAISKSDLNQIVLPVPPLNEQCRIVAKLEKLLNRVDAGQTRLSSIPRILKRFRQSVLAAAFSGKLTADWRANQPTFETASRLISEISTLRRQRFNEAQRIAEGRGRKKPRDYDNYDPAVRTDLELFDIPDKWEWVDLRFLMDEQEPFCYGVVQPSVDDPNGVFLVRAGDLQDGSVNTTELRRIPIEVDNEYSRSRIKGGELLVTVVGANIGTVSIAPIECRGFNIARAVAKIPIQDFSTRYVFYWLNTSKALTWMKDDAREVARPTLNLEQLKTILVPLPSVSEQREIVRRVEALFKTANMLEARYQTAKAHVDKLTQSILAKAFRGELVPQDPNDEPASALLERIKDDHFPIARARASGKTPMKNVRRGQR